MIIIVEGVDRVGKSTFCNMLQEKGYKLLDSKIHTDESDVSTEVYDRLQEERTVAQAQLLSLLDKSTKIVIDRFHLSQAVYGMLNRARITWPHMRLLEELLKDNSMLVYIKSENLSRSSTEHGSDLSNHAAYFDALYNDSILCKIYGSYSSLHKLVRYILEVDNGN